MNWQFAFLLLPLIFGFTTSKKATPPGMVLIQSGLYADQTEVTNLSWQEYLHDMQVRYGAASENYRKALPDTTVWNEVNPLLTAKYLRHPLYKNYPVVGVSYEQVLAFCKWRTERVIAFYRLRYKDDWHIEYRLPTEQEWESMALWESYQVNNNSSQKPLFNCKETCITPHTIQVKLFNKSLTGQYQLLGNVAEMVLEKNKAKGGSWFHSAEECRTGLSQSYFTPTAWLGFRCVCVVNPQ